MSQEAAVMDPRAEPGSPLERAWDRIWDVLRLKGAVFAKVAADRSATKQCMAIFAVASALGAIESLVWAPFLVAASFVMLAVEAVVLRLVARIFSPPAHGFMAWLRALMLASAPSAFAAVPGIGLPVAVCYALATLVLVVRELAPTTTGKAIAVVVICALAPAVALGGLVAMLAFSFIPALLT